MVTQTVELAVSRTRRGTPVFSFIGCSGAGKTTLLVGVVQELKRLGYRVATVKHTPHGFDIDHPGKDSWRFTEAGSDMVILSSPERLCVIENVGAEVTLPEIEDLVGDKADVVLVEGYKDSACAKVLVLNDRLESPCLDQTKCLATISPGLYRAGAVLQHDEDVANVAALLVREIERSHLDAQARNI